MANLNEELDKIQNTKDSTSEFDPNDIAQNKVMAILSYLGILILVPLFGAKESKFARFHTNQALIIWIGIVAVAILGGILGGIPLIGWLFNIIEKLITLVLVILDIIGIINACNGKAKELPIIGSIRILK